MRIRNDSQCTWCHRYPHPQSGRSCRGGLGRTGLSALVPPPPSCCRGCCWGRARAGHRTAPRTRRARRAGSRRRAARRTGAGWAPSQRCSPSAGPHSRYTGPCTTADSQIHTDSRYCDFLFVKTQKDLLSVFAKLVLKPTLSWAPATARPRSPPLPRAQPSHPLGRRRRGGSPVQISRWIYRYSRYFIECRYCRYL